MPPSGSPKLNSIRASSRLSSVPAEAVQQAVALVGDSHAVIPHNFPTVIDVKCQTGLSTKGAEVLHGPVAVQEGVILTTA